MSEEFHPQEEYRTPYHWALTGFYQYAYEMKFQYVKPYLEKTDVVLDVGGGDGKFSAMAAPYVKEVWCVDVNERALRFGALCTEGIDNIRFEKMHAESLAFENSRFDKVFFIEVIEHVPKENVAGVLGEIRRVVTPGGTFFLSTPNRRNLRARMWGERSLSRKHAYEYDVAELEELLSSAGFVIKEKRGIYLPIPIPRIEHFANVVPFRPLFRWLVRAGNRTPELAESVWIAATPR